MTSPERIRRSFTSSWAPLSLSIWIKILAWPWLGQWQWVRQGLGAAAQIPKKSWLRALAWSGLFNLIFFAQFYFLLCGWGAVPARALWGIPLFFGIKTLLPFSVMDLGVREGAAVLVFSQLQLDPAVAFNAAFILFVLNALVPGLGGLALLWQRPAQGLGTVAQ